FQFAQLFLAMIAPVQLDFSFNHVLSLITGVVSTLGLCRRAPLSCCLCCQLSEERAMAKRSGCIVVGFAVVVVVWLCPGQSLALRAQQTERPGNSLDHPIAMPRDLSGLSIKNPRVRVVHTTDAAKEGGSLYLQQVDPWLGYQWGRSLFQRNFRERDGVYGD